MRRNRTPRIMATAAALTLLATSTAFAQFDDDDPLVSPVEGVRTAVVLNANTDDSVNAAIAAEARAAHLEIGGVIDDKKPKLNAFFESTEPDRMAVVQAAVDDANDANNLVIISGGDSQSIIGVVSRTPTAIFIDLGQPLPCVDERGSPDRTGACLGGELAMPFNYSAVTFGVEDPAYLAGVVAASASRNDRLGIISGMADCDECNRYIQGFIQGARSIEPDITINQAFLADEDEAIAFGDAVSATAFAEAFIDVFQPDVLLPIAEGASVGMIEAACDAGILVVGTGVDVARQNPELAECVLASVTKDVRTAVRHAVYDFSTGNYPRVREMTLADGYVGLTEEWRLDSTIPVGVKDLYADAFDGLVTGQIDACPTDCGKPYGPDGPLQPVEPPAATAPPVADDAAAGE